MRNTGLLTILAAFLFLASCADKPARPGNILSDAQKAAADAAATAAANAGIQGAPAGVANLPHYYCPNSCEGSGGDAQANCPTCGTAYVHNAAFHNQTPAGTNPAVTPGGTPPVTPPAAAAQNANGVYHYTCANGCAGGAVAQGSCATCGGALAHNDAYHN